MRVFALIVVVWSFVGMPTLCRAGVLVECCALGVPGHEKPNDAPDECANKCSCDNRDKYPDDTESSEPRDCDSCTESCNVVSPYSKQADRAYFAAARVAVTAAAQAFAEGCLPHANRSRDMSAAQLPEHIPYPVSDRPLLI